MSRLRRPSGGGRRGSAPAFSVGQGRGGVQGAAASSAKQANGANNKNAHAFAAGAGSGGGGGVGSGGAAPSGPSYALPIIAGFSHIYTFGGTVVVDVVNTGVVSPNDFLISHASRRRQGAQGSPHLGTPTGWTALWVEEMSSTFASASGMFYRVATGGEGNVTSAVPGGDWSGTYTWRITGVDPNDPIAAFTSGQTTSTTLTMASLIAARINSMLIGGVAAGEAAAAPGTSLAVLDDSDRHTTGDGFMHGEGHEDVLDGIAGTGTRVFTASGMAGSCRGGGGMVLLNPVLA